MTAGRLDSRVCGLHGQGKLRDRRSDVARGGVALSRDFFPIDGSVGDRCQALGSEMNSPVPLDPAFHASALGGEAGSAETHLCILDLRGRIQFCGNPELFGRRMEDMLGQPLSAFIPGLPLRDATPGYNVAYVNLWFRQDEWRRHSAEDLEGREIPLDVRLRKLEVDGQNWLLAMLRAVPCDGVGEQGIVSRILAAEDDAAAVMVTDARGRIEYVNSVFESTTGYSMEELRGHTPAVLKSGIHNLAFYAGMWARLSAGLEFRGLFINRRKDGEVFFEDKAIQPFFGPDGLVTHYVSRGQDISARVQELEGRPLAIREPAPAPAPLADRRVYFDRLQHALARAGRRGARLGVACIKLDASQDAAEDGQRERRLQLVTACLQSCLRKSDTAAHIAPGEFALILEDLQDVAIGEAVLERIVATLREGVTLDGAPLPVEVSIGMSVYPEDGQNELGLLLRADCAMQQAQAAGGGRHAVFRTGRRKFKLYCNADDRVVA